MILDRLSIRVRITIGTLVIAAVFFGAASLLVHREVESVLDNATQTLLETDLSQYEDAVGEDSGDPLDIPGEDQLIAVINPAGSVVASSLPDALTSSFASINLDSAEVQPVVASGTTYSVLVETDTIDGGDWTIVAARTDAASALILEGLTRALAVGLVVLTILFGAASWFLTSAALRPITRLRRSAEELVGANSANLLPEGRARDEVHDLAVTLNALIEQLRDSAEREKQMVSDASHELRTPLAILQGQLELIRTGDGTHTVDDIVAAEKAAARMADLVTNLLELSRLESGEHRGSATLDEVAREVAESVDRARFAARASAITIDFDVDADGDRSVLLSAHDVGRIVDNLVSNAVRSLGADGMVTVSVVASDDLIIDVHDTGAGMPEEFIARALDRFSQLDDARGGSGLGLSIVAAAARSGGGSVQLGNRVEGGFAVRVSLPLSSD